MSTPAIRRLLQATSAQPSNLKSGQSTKTILTEIQASFAANVHEGQFLIDPSTVGRERFTTYHNIDLPDREMRLKKLRWCTPLDGIRAQSEEAQTRSVSPSDEAAESAGHEPLERLVNRYVLTVDDDYYLLENFLGDEREKAIVSPQCGPH